MNMSKSRRPSQSQETEAKLVKKPAMEVPQLGSWSSDKAAVLRTAAKLRRPGACDCNCNCCGD
jgi:hypothetical protein